jgi:hypothetical protein
MSTPHLPHRPLQLFLTFLITWFGLEASIRPVFGWGRIGHRVSGRLAEARLSPAARAAVRDLLEPGESLADASTWADDYRRDFPESGPWHYVNVPITEPRFDVRFCPPEGCVVSKIKDFRLILADRETPRADRQKALRFLTHFVQDMHQPVHVGDRSDRGGNDLQLQFFGRGSNLHRIWDSGLIEHAFESEEALFQDLQAGASPELVRLWEQGTVEDWANESFTAAQRAYCVPGTVLGLKPGMKLGREYEQLHLPVARMRVHQSAIRLASILNGIYR